MNVKDILEETIDVFPDVELSKGKRIFHNYKNKIVLCDISSNQWKFKIPSESTSSFYNVTLKLGDNFIFGECDCPAFDAYDDCKHCAAALLFLREKPALLNGLNEANGNTVADKTTVYRAHAFPIKIYELVQGTGINDVYNYSKYAKNILHNGDWTDKMQFEYFNKKEKFHIEISYDHKNFCTSSCNCLLPKVAACIHIFSAFAYIIQNKGEMFFAKFRDNTGEKNELLKPYGLSITDQESNDFKFAYDYNGTLKLHSVPDWFLPVKNVSALDAFSKKLYGENEIHEALRPSAFSNTIIDFELGFLLNLNPSHIVVSLEPLSVKVVKNKIDYKKISLNKKSNWNSLKELSNEQFEQLICLSDESIQQHIKQNGSDYFYFYQNWKQQLTAKDLERLKKYYYECLLKMWGWLTEKKHLFYLEDNNRFSNVNIKKAKLNPKPVSLFFVVEKDDRFVTVRLKLKDVEASHFINYQILLKANEEFFIPADWNSVTMLEQFKNGFIKAPVHYYNEVVHKIVLPLQKKFEVHLPEGLEIQSKAIQPVPRVLFSELNDSFLMLKPQFDYESNIVEMDEGHELVNQTDGNLIVYHRDKTAEKTFFESLRTLHPFFENQKQNPFYYLPFADVMKNNWFLNTVHVFRENNIPVYGMDTLKKFRYNTNKPVWNMKSGSSIDWFDLKIEIKFGDETVPLKDVRAALLNKQNIVLLSDGSFGLLPQEWLSQFGMLLKMGNENNGTLRVSKLHFTLLDELHSQIDDEKLLREIEIKKEKLREIENIQTVVPSKKIKAKLRPYQTGGFKWMQTLHQLDWGGCLADDMGLGKTLQAITFLRHLAETHRGSTHLVICPTSLIYNWETELKKFCPSLKYHIYYGIQREFEQEHFENYDIIITSYGIARNDFELLQKHIFHCMILDESQAIKNPDALTTKAVSLLNARVRFILTGTPVQNNTYDLYAQMNFLNPGLLGSREFFKTEFSNPIDKNDDKEKAAQLRKIIFPFMLRRTKEQVAPELPDRTETVLWCQMEKDQRNVYDSYKNYYREALLKKIEELGMAKSGIYILEGMLRLRQICDSPLLLKKDEFKTSQSVKINELIRAMEESIGSHKLLVFSQFTEMLSLIAASLTEKKFPFSYLDGKTSAINRKKAVDEFQNNDKIKIFLISIKAGGVGLNLTAADYVYIVDPWWNPAVEQQAIDRTHRIGQTKNIFAYRMICKDSIEEKIMQLQDRKRNLSKDLIADDTGFVKKLTKEDVEYLFS